jgi:integrase
MANTLQRVSKNKWPGVYCYESKDRKEICYYITYKVDGKKHTEKVGWKSEGYSPQVAAEIRAKRVKDARHGKAVKTEKEIRQDKVLHDRPLDEIKKAYFDSDRGEKLKGRVTDLNRYEKHIEKLLGKKTVSKLTQLDMERLKRDMQSHKPATVANALELLRRLINYGVKHKYCQALSFKIELPQKNNEVTEYLTPEEAQRFLKVLEGWPNQDVSRMLKLAMFSGLRRGEIFKLKKVDLDFHQNLIWLRDPKGGKDVSIPMSNIIRDILYEQLAFCDERHPESPFVFPAGHGGRRTDSTAVNRIKKKAELPARFRIFHGLRHNLGVTLANSGEYTLDMIGELLTHKSVAVTRRYAQFLPETKKKAADRAAEILSKKTKKNVVDLNKSRKAGNG